jgi:hypothetical protein
LRCAQAGPDTHIKLKKTKKKKKSDPNSLWKKKKKKEGTLEINPSRKFS